MISGLSLVCVGVFRAVFGVCSGLSLGVGFCIHASTDCASITAGTSPQTLKSTTQEAPGGFVRKNGICSKNILGLHKYFRL